jgi:hypothetical protein
VGIDLAANREVTVPDQTVRIREDVFTVPGLFIASVLLQPNLNENAINVTVRDIPVVEDVRRVFLQVRQSTTDRTFPDQFSTQVIKIDDDSLVFRIKRLDSQGGWGQRLHVQILLEHPVEGG